MLKLKNGHSFEGKWVEDDFVEGIVLYSNGDVYEGEMKNYLRNGYGTYTYYNSK